MTSPGGAPVIGAVSVRVRIDTTGTRQEAQRELDIVEDSLDPIEVEMTVDSDGVVTEAVAARDAAQAAMRDLVLRVNIDDTGDLERALAQINNQLVNLGRIDLPVGINEDDLNAARDLIQERLHSTGVDIRVDLDAEDSIRRAINQIDTELSRLREVTINARLNEADLNAARSLLLDRLDNLRVDIDPDVDTNAIGRAEGAIARLARDRAVRLRPELDFNVVSLLGTQLARLSGLRLVTDQIDEMIRAWQRIDLVIPQISLLSEGVLGLVGYIGTAISNIAALAYGIAQIGPLVLALPAVFASLGIAIGVASAAFQDFGTKLPTVSVQLAEMQDRISANFWAQAEAPMRHFFDTFLSGTSTFSLGIDAVASSLGGLLGQLALDLAAGLNVQPMFQALLESLGILGQATAPLTNIINLLGLAGSQVLPILTEKTVEWISTFSDWLSDKGVDQLAAMFEHAIFQAGELFRALGGIGNILLGIGEAARLAGGSTITSFADTLDRVAEVVQGPAFQDTLIKFFAASHEAMTAIADQSGPAFYQMIQTIAQTVSQVLPLVGQTIGIVFEQIFQALSNPAIQQGVTQMIAGISSGLASFSQALVPVAGSMQELFSFIGTLAATFGPVLGTAFSVLATSLQGVLPALEPIVKQLGSSLVIAMQILAPVIAQVSAAFGEMITAGALPLISTLLTSLIPVISQLAGSAVTLSPVLTTIGTTFAELLVSLAPLIDSLLQLTVAIVGPLIEALAPLVSAILPPLASAIGAVASALVPIIDLITTLVDILVPVLVPAFVVFQTVLAEGVGATIKTTVDLISGIIAILAQVGEFLVNIFTGKWSAAWDNLSNIGKIALDTISSIIKNALDGIKNGISSALAAVGSNWDEAWSAIKNYFGQTIDNALALLTAFLDKLISAPKSAMDSVLNSWRSAWNSVTTLASSAWSDITAAISSGIADLLARFAALPSQALSALGNLGSFLSPAGRDFVQGFINGAQGMISNVVSTLRNMASQAVAAVTSALHIGSPSRVMEQIGSFTVEGFIDGIESRFSDVRRSLRSMADDVAATQFDLPVRAAMDNALASLASSGGNSRVLNYYAAPGSSLGSQEDLFAAAGRARMVW